MPISCPYCPCVVPPGMAQRSLRDTGEPLCLNCRRSRYPVHPTAHQAPPGCSVVIRPEGYGRYSCELVTPAGTFHGSGLSDHLALSRARAAYTAAAP